MFREFYDLIEMAKKEDWFSLGYGFLSGDDSSLSRGLKLEFRELGLSHLTAASGANLELVAGLGRWPVVLGYFGAQLSALGLIVAYGAWLGWPGSVVRALLTWSLREFGKFSGRKVSSSWFVILIAGVGLFHPALQTSKGYWLSAFGWLGTRISQICTSGEKKDSVLPQALVESLFVSWICWLCVLPLSWWWFGQAPLIAPWLTVLIQLVLPLYQYLELALLLLFALLALIPKQARIPSDLLLVGPKFVGQAVFTFVQFVLNLGARFTKVGGSLWLLCLAASVLVVFALMQQVWRKYLTVTRVTLGEESQWEW